MNQIVFNCRKIRFLTVLIFLCTTAAQAQNMKYVLSNASQVTSVSRRDLKAIPVLRMEVVTAGARDPLAVLKFALNTNGTTNVADISRAKVYYTGADTRFDTTAVFGSVGHPDGSFEVSGAQTLVTGDNYFWLAYDVATGAAAGHVMDAEFNSAVIGNQEYTKVWADEFDSGISPDPANWKFENGFMRNHEFQWYQPENATCSNGILTIEARQEHKPNPKYVAGSTDWRESNPFIEYTSSSINTAGKHTWQYGRFELRARIDTSMGMWPAWWTLGVQHRWPSNGEIDIMEYYRKDLLANIAIGTATPYKAKWYSTKKPVSSFPDHESWARKFHVWRMDWDENSISLYVDDSLLNSQPMSELYNRDSTIFNPFRQPHYMLINLAVGGDNGGDPKMSPSPFPKKYEIDYVRVYQKKTGRFLSVAAKTPVTQAPAGTAYTVPATPVANGLTAVAKKK